MPVALITGRRSCARSRFNQAGALTMKKTAIIILASISLALPSVAQEPVPYAYRPSRQGEGYIPTLAAIMREIQLCHIKLFYAGQQSNWPLANYEVAQIENN